MRMHANMVRCTAVILVTMLTACATGYRGAGQFFLPENGYKEEKAAGGLIKVRYAGTRDHLMYKVENYALYRCAEIAQRERSPYFALYQTLPDALQNRTSDKVRPTTLGGVPQAEVYISLRRSAAPGLLSTSEVLARLAPFIAASTK